MNLKICNLLFLIAGVLTSTAAMAQNITHTMQNKMRFLALGDSYTIGEAVKPEERWPHVLVQHLQKEGFEIGLPDIIATTGWTTDELKKAILEKNPAADYDLVSLLIGVNNQYRGYPIENYRKEFEELLLMAISFAEGNKERVFVVSIPDYGVTPFGAKKEPVKIAAELDEYNAISKEISDKMGVSWYNITDISRQAKDDATLTAEDQLHPSGKMYALWVQSFLSQIMHQLGRK